MKSARERVRRFVKNRLLRTGSFGDRPPFVPNGHYYSPVVDRGEAGRDRARIWPDEPECAGIDFNRDGQERLLAEEFARYLPDYDYPDVAPGGDIGTSFHHDNPYFAKLDSRALFVMLRHLRPRKLIEVGCGFSTLLTADVNRRFLNGSIDVTCIEPYPQPFLRQGIPGISRLIAQRVQEVPPSFFDLRAGDLLFIDSSHVAKTGSDVNHLYFEVLPRLAPGVLIHIHDIFLPFDYPQYWIAEGRSWNEQYLVRALLAHSRCFRVLFGSTYASHYLRDRVERVVGGTSLDGSSSLWLEWTGRT